MGAIFIKGAGGGAGASADLLWTNPNPSTLAAGTIALDLADYDYVIVTTNLSGSNTANGYAIAKVGSAEDTCIGCKSWDSANSRMNANIRRFRASSTGVYFYNGGYSTSETSANRCVPYQIYGVRADLGIL